MQAKVPLVGGLLRLTQLEKENARFKRFLAEAELETGMLKYPVAP
jgi:hypothetical protein